MSTLLASYFLSVGVPLVSVAIIYCCCVHLIKCEIDIKTIFELLIKMWMSLFRSEAAWVMYYEVQLAAESKKTRLQEEELLRVRRQFHTFLKNDLQSFSFFGLQWWKLCSSQCAPTMYQLKLLKIIELQNIARADLTLSFILIFVGKIMKTNDINKTLWEMLHKLLDMSRSTNAIVEIPLWETMEIYDIHYLMNFLDDFLAPEMIDDDIKRCCHEILNRIHQHYTSLKMSFSWKQLRYYGLDTESIGELEIYNIEDNADNFDKVDSAKEYTYSNVLSLKKGKRKTFKNQLREK